MSFKETWDKLFHPGRKTSRVTTVLSIMEIGAIGEKQISFCDLSKPEDAQKIKARPGYYFLVSPVTFQERENWRSLINDLSLGFHTILGDLGLSQQGDSIIPIDTKAEFKIDPAMIWRFLPEKYLPERQILFIKADHIDPAVAQNLIVKSLSKRK
ncbi:MAG: hypothetical protein NTZ93_02615 [Candidatus Beckwithbacteria bacterium]|nr:hypothetical protein [Candidatus Beckwithbacteria bacterium]